MPEHSQNLLAIRNVPDHDAEVWDLSVAAVKVVTLADDGESVFNASLAGVRIGAYSQGVSGPSGLRTVTWPTEALDALVEAVTAVRDHARSNGVDTGAAQ
jgi:hypothetical protein